ncbi:MAG: SLC13 family permease [Verrucomicrobia bacterium]|nr:SLC13 family permease [Verrucomicrobiota bacterium]MDA1068657.1 SLC13 family permease [Verrucomicrobiota bacterium]
MDPIFVLLLGIVIVFAGILLFKLHAFFTLILAAMAVAAFTSTDMLTAYWIGEGESAAAAAKLANSAFGERVAISFGVTCGKIGIVICMASIIGKCLLDSGAAMRIVRTILRMLGEKNAPAAMGVSGFVLGIPVFFDTVFYLLIPLAKALAASTKKNYGLYVLAIIAGGSIAHSQIPPTPGPLFVAEMLNIEIGVMMMGGIVVGGIAASCGMVYAYWINKVKPIPFRDMEDGSDSNAQSWDNLKDEDLPSFWISVSPILLPLLLLSGKTILTTMAGAIGMELPSWLNSTVQWLGDKNVALTIAACLGIFTLYRAKKNQGNAVKTAMQSALASGGIVLMITCAGGSFGGMLQQSGIRGVVEQFSDATSMGLLPMAFILTALIRTVQGSATVAMITSVGILAPLAASGTLGFHPIYLAMVIGFGSKPFPWMNDSGFWVISKMSGMTEGETIINFSFMATIMATVGLIICMIASSVLPLV